MKRKFTSILFVVIAVAMINLIFPNIIDESVTTAEENNGQGDTAPIADNNIYKFTIDDLNIRTGPSIDYDEIITIPIGEKVMVVGKEKGWDKVVYQEWTGYVNADYLTDFKEVAQEAVASRNKLIEYKDSLDRGEVLETMKVIDGILLANKVFDLSSDYNPGENPEATNQLHKMFQAAEKDIKKVLTAYSSFRSYDYQKNLYNNYVKKDGEAKASMYSAKAGRSEHQTGLAFDIGGTDQNYWLETSFEETIEGDWLKENAHKYGFILRYPKGKTDITGYQYEPWHFRYIGIEHATNVYENNLTLEEYLLGKN